jgi:asparagine synthase (glutamine-hydrolysing)
MCGITAYITKNRDTHLISKRKHFLEISKKIRHRGPDWNGIYINNENGVVITHERLSIVGVDNGSQPIIHKSDFQDRYDNIVLSVNGEIYNYHNLYEHVLHNKYTRNTKSDCEVIMHLYEEFGSECVKMLDGIFSFVLFDTKNNRMLVARDPIGIIPLYIGITEDNSLMFASEMKSLDNDCVFIDSFPPGHFLEILPETKYENILQSNNGSFSINIPTLTKYYNPKWYSSNYISYKDSEVETLYNDIRRTLTKSVEKRLMADVPFGVLLSGGLDSSLIASIANRLIKEKKGAAWGNNLHSFSIGLKDAPDLKYARIVADFLGTIHHEYNFTVQEGIDALEDLIYHLETYDVTTIRASTPMFLMSRKIKSMGIKMVLSGEGADEMLGGYLYFHSAPNNDEFHRECVSRVKNLHNFDCLRANKSTMSWGLEARVPFLDKSLLELIMPITPKLKLKDKKEKYVLRQAFHYENDEEKYLPDEILWRQKEQFSDGVGYNWIDGLKELIETQITDKMLQLETEEYKKKGFKDVPRNKEELYYRRIFDRLFNNRSSIVPRWIPKMEWEGVSYDPSGRAQKVHNNAS